MSEVRELRGFCWTAGEGSCFCAKRKGMITHTPLKYRQSQKWREIFMACKVVKNIRGEETYRELTVIRTGLGKQGQF
jgi:hypothetical protein